MQHRIPSETELNEALGRLPGWQHKDGKLRKTFIFSDFVSAFSWMTRVAFLAESMGHHPEWKNVYNQVEVALQTHDLESPQVSQTDLQLARGMEKAYAL